MKKLVTALIIVLPLILLIALFAITGIVRISADIPATGITIANRGKDGVIVLDIADYSSPLYEKDLGVEVQPIKARNKKYSLSITDISGINKSEIVTKDESGAFRLKDVGVAKLTFTSQDGGYTASVLLNVIASGALDFTPVIKSGDGELCELDEGVYTDYAVTLTSGSYSMTGSCFPASVLSANVTYECDNSQILDFIGSNGQFNANFCGETIVKMTVAKSKGSMSKTIAVKVVPAGEVTLNGGDAVGSQARLSASIGKRDITFCVQTSKDIEESDISISGEFDSFDVTAVDDISNAFYVTMRLAENFTYPASAPYTLTVDGESYPFFVDFAIHSVSVFAPTNELGSGEIIGIIGSSMRISAFIEPHDLDMQYEWRIEDPTCFGIVSASSDSCLIKARSVGETTATLTWTAYDGDTLIASGEETRTLVAIKGYSSILFAENADTYGMGNLAIASDKYVNGEIKKNVFQAKLKTFDSSGGLMEFRDLEFSSSDNNLATISGDSSGVYITAKSTGTVTVSASWKYGKLFAISPAKLTFTAVDGVQVRNDEGLRAAFAGGRAAVLTEDVYLGENLFNVSANGVRTPKYSDSVMREKLLRYTGEIKTTADWTYYKNTGRSHPSVRYCLDITANLYGNGKFISAEFITNMLDATDTPYDFAVFKGPLDFVSSNTDGAVLAAVKGQDNISFLVRTDGVTIDNVILKGCDDKTLYDDGSLNLSLLNYVGTTLEVMADASVINSRIMNGRTVLRAFGRYGVSDNSAVNVENEKINVTIDGCVLQNAREFLLKVGSNRVIRGTKNNKSPYLVDASGKNYTAHNSPECDDYIDDAYFMSNYVITDVTLKDSVLRTSGMLSIGIESHFAGELLYKGVDFPLFPLRGWENLAATSYPAILRLVGKVVIADWKDISAVDSSTLIESQSTDESLAFLALNIAAMLKTVQEKGGEQYANIISKKNNVSYVHGGIAFYGGGKNYSILDTSRYTFEKMNEYVVNLDILKQSNDATIRQQGNMLPLAAGYESFRFVMFGSTSNFDYNAQNKLH